MTQRLATRNTASLQVQNLKTFPTIGYAPSAEWEKKTLKKSTDKTLAWRRNNFSVPPFLFLVTIYDITLNNFGFIRISTISKFIYS